MKKFHLALFVATIAFLSSASPAPAQDRRSYRHDDFFLRAAGGFGYMTNSISFEDDIFGEEITSKASGVSMFYDFALGGVVANRLAFHINFLETVMLSPTFEYEVSGETHEPPGDADGGTLAFGFGLTYFFMPINMYISPEFGFNSLILKEDGEDIPDTGMGFLTRMLVGKEFWVSDNWGLGFALVFDYLMNSDSDIEETWHGMCFGGLISATYD